MSAAVCGKRSASLFEDQQQQLPHAAPLRPPSAPASAVEAGAPRRPAREAPTPDSSRRSALGSPSSASRHRGFCAWFVLGGAGAGEFSLPTPENSKFIEKALEECGNDLDSAIKCLLVYQVQSPEYNAPHLYQSHIGMSSGGQVPAKGVLDSNEVSAPVEGVTCAESLPSSTVEWVEILMNEMANASGTVDDNVKARALRVLEFFETSVASRIGADALKSLQKENVIYKEQLEAVIKENYILKKAVAIQHERQKEQDERNQELQQLKQLVVQYQEQVRSLEINNYALSMHLRQAQQGNLMAGHFNRDIF